MTLLFSLTISIREDHVISMLILLTGVLCHLLNFFSSYQVFLLVFNSSGGRMLLISSSIIPSSQVHVQFLPFTVGVLPKLYHSYSFLSRFNQSGSNSFLSIVLVIHSFATSKVHMVFLISIFLPQCSQLCSTPLCSLFQLFNLSRFVVSLVRQRSKLVLPLLFLFHFSLRCHSRSRDEILS